MLARFDGVFQWLVWAAAAAAVLLLLAGPRVVAHDEPKKKARAAPGVALFKTNCGSCHTLEEAGTTGVVGPPLDGVGLSVDTVVATMRAGPSAMPAFKLRPADERAIATFVAQASR